MTLSLYDYNGAPPLWSSANPSPMELCLGLNNADILCCDHHNTNVQKQTHVHACIHSRVHTHTCTHTHTHAHTHARTHTHTHTHTHTYT